MRENSIYTITPPDMVLTESGPSITIVSTDKKFVTKVENIHERIFKSVPISIYHCDGNANESNMAWLISVMRFSDNIFVDLDTVNDIGLLCAIFSDTNIIFINEGRTRLDLAKLINSTKNGYNVYDSLDDYVELILNTV